MGLEDFMNVKEATVTNDANLSIFIVDVGQALLQPFRQFQPDYSILDLVYMHISCISIKVQ